MTYFNNISVNYNDSSNLDAFSRLRISQDVGLFESKPIYGKNLNYLESLNGVGASSTYNVNQSSITLAVGTASGEYTIRQSRRYFPYTPGKSQIFVGTGILGSGLANNVKRIGLFDDKNGLFFELNGTTLNVVRRTYTSGSAVDNSISQTNWNIDKLDGTGTSGITLDLTKTQIFIIDFQWLGVGRIRFGFGINGEIIYCHEINNANTLDLVYMSTPTLPIRYEIRNTGITSGSSQLIKICSSVATEGGFFSSGLVFNATNGATTRSVSGTSIPVFAIRLKTAFGTINNRINLKLLKLRYFTGTENTIFRLYRYLDVSSVTGTWSDVNTTYSGTEYSLDISAISGTGILLDSTYGISTSTGAVSTSSSTEVNTTFIDQQTYLSQNLDSTNSEIFVIFAQSLSTATPCSISATWIEFS